MGFTAAGISTDHVSTTQAAPLGFELTVPDGDKGNQVWIYIKNAESSASLIAGTVVGRLGSSATYQGILCPTSETALRVIGIAQHTIAAGSYGFVLRRGEGTILCDTGFSANAGLQVGNGTAGRADAAGGALTHPAFGFSLAAISTGETGSAYFNCLG